MLDRVLTGVKPDLVRALDATYHTGRATNVGFQPDVIVECTGVAQVIADSSRGPSGGVVCLTGVGSGGRTTGFTADVAAAMVLQNNVIVGSVNANRRHWYKAAQVLARADPAWLGRLITRCEPPERLCGRSNVSRKTSRWSSSSRRHERSVSHGGDDAARTVYLLVSLDLTCSPKVDPAIM